MEVIQINDWILKVERLKTVDKYSDFEFLQNTDEARNFSLICENDWANAPEFLLQLGIDLAKPFELQATVVEAGNAVMYSGKYYFVGQVEQGEIDEWDLNVEDYCFSLTKEIEEHPFSDVLETVEISFEVVLPWKIIPTIK